MNDAPFTLVSSELRVPPLLCRELRNRCHRQHTMITFHVITIFPEMFDSYLSESILKRAQEESHIQVNFYNPRDFVEGTHKVVDDTPYGGGPGMVMKAEPILKAVRHAVGKTTDAKILLLSARGEQFTNTYADTLVNTGRDVVLIVGRYEGVDARVKDVLHAEEVSVGPYTLTGGELPAMVIVDVIARRLPGVLGADESVEERRVAGKDVYTRPETFKDSGKTYNVPEVLLSGDHKRIEEWRKGK